MKTRIGQYTKLTIDPPLEMTISRPGQRLSSLSQEMLLLIGTPAKELRHYENADTDTRGSILMVSAIIWRERADDDHGSYYAYGQGPQGPTVYGSKGLSISASSVEAWRTERLKNAQEDTLLGLLRW